jgi:HKD family nuclease
VPINRRPHVFHPKLYLLLGDQRVSGIVGSNNCTNAGIAYNMELCSVFSVGSGSAVEADRSTRAVLRQIYNALRTFASDAGAASETIEREFFKPIEEQHPWLHRNVVELTNQRPIELLHSHREPLWPQLKKQLGDKTVRKIAILAPFNDRDLGFLKMVKAKWPDAQLTIIAQQKYATLEGKKIAGLLRSGKKGRLLAVTPPAGRRLHAKAFAFETSGETFWLTGSANATEAAMDGRNTESVLWFSTKEPIESILKDDSLTIETLDPSKFQSGGGTEPTNNDFQPVADLRLESPCMKGVLLILGLGLRRAFRI